MKVLIVEDEQYSAERLQSLLLKIDEQISVVATLSSVESCLKWFRNNKEPNLIFLDIHLEDKNSFELFDEISISAPIIYTTAYDQYALKAFKQNSIDYLLKPVVKEELEFALEKFKSKVKTSTEEVPKDRFLVKRGSQLASVSTEDIAYIKTEEKLNYIITFEKERYVIDFTLDQMHDKLAEHTFFRINRNRIISIKSINKIHNHFNGRLKLDLLPKEDEEIFVSRERVNDFKNWLGR